MLIIEVLVLMLMIMALGSIASASAWILSNIGAVLILMFLKSLLMVGKPLLAKDKTVAYYLSAVGLIAADALRTGGVVWGIVNVLSDMMSGGLLNFIADIFVLVVVGGLLACVGEAPMYLVYENCESDDVSTEDLVLDIVLEIVSAVLIVLINLWLAG